MPNPRTHDQRHYQLCHCPLQPQRQPGHGIRRQWRRDGALGWRNARAGRRSFHGQHLPGWTSGRRFGYRPILAQRRSRYSVHEQRHRGGCCRLHRRRGIWPEQHGHTQPQVDGTVEIIAGGATVPAGLTLPSGIAYDPNYSQAFVRFNADGTLDTSFGVDGYAVAPSSSPLQLQLCSVSVQSNGNIVYAGESSISSTSRQFVTVVQFSPDGVLNTGFGNPTAQGQSGSADVAVAAMATRASTTTQPATASASRFGSSTRPS